MKPILGVLIGLFTAGLAAQTTPESLSRLRPVYQKEYKPQREEILLRMPYAKSEFVDLRALKSIRAEQIASVCLYYSEFALSPTFNQPALNLERFRELQKYLPGVFSNPSIKWEVIGQTDCRVRDCAENLFHGFSIRMNKHAGSGDRKAELATTEKIIQDREIIFDTVMTPKIKKSVRYLPVSKRKLQQGIVYRKKGNWNRQKILLYDTVRWTRKLVPARMNPVIGQDQVFSDSVIFTAFNRNKWENMVVVTDVTGSMSPYFNQLLLWYYVNYHNQSVSRFVFFNDGDTKPDSRKKIGTTGGIYFTETGNVLDMEKVMLQAVKAGNGGDIMENDIESLIAAIDKCSSCENIILIADNNSNMRDFPLISKLGKPVKVVLCGVGKMINPQYVYLAYATGGSIHTMEQDFLDLTIKNSDNIISISGTKYRISRGKVELVVEN